MSTAAEVDALLVELLSGSKNSDSKINYSKAD